MFRVQKQLARLQTRLHDHHHTKAQAKAKHQQAQDQLKTMKGRCARTTSQNAKAKANGEKAIHICLCSIVQAKKYRHSIFEK